MMRSGLVNITACRVLLPCSLLLLSLQPYPAFRYRDVRTIDILRPAQFLQELQSWAASDHNSTTMLALPPGLISLRNISFTPSNITASTGTLVVKGAGDLGAGEGTILDLAQLRSGLLSLGGTAMLHLSDLTIINSCLELNWWSKSLGIPSAAATLLSFFGFPGPVTSNGRFMYRSRRYTNVTVYAPFTEAQGMAWWVMAAWTPFPKVKALLTDLLLETVVPPASIRSVSPTRLEFQFFMNAVAAHEDFVIQAPNSVASPLKLTPPYVGTDPAGTLMPLALCNKIPLNAASYKRNLAYGEFQIWIMDGSPGNELAPSFQQMVEFAQRKAALGKLWGPPMGLLLENLTLDDAAAAAAAFEAEVVLQGPFNHDPAYVKTVALDFGGRPGAIRLGAGGQLFVDKLVLKGLPALSLGQLAHDPQHAQHVSALPMWALTNTNDSSSLVAGGRERLSLFNSTLVLPVSDYAVLLAAAQQGWQPSAAAAAGAAAAPPPPERPGSSRAKGEQEHPVLALVDGFEARAGPGPLHVPGAPLYLLLLNLTCLGIQARHLTVVPDTPLPKGYPFPRVVPHEEGPMGRGKLGNKAAIAVGAAVGGGCVLVLTAMAICMRRARCFGRMKKGDVEQGGKPLPSAQASDPSTCSQPPDEPHGKAPETDGSEQRHPTLDKQDTSFNTSAEGRSRSTIKQLSSVDLAAAVETAAGKVGSEDVLMIKGILGRGAWGVVYRGIWRNMDVAIKTVLFNANLDEMAKEHAIKEAAVCTSVVHPNIVVTYHYDVKAIASMDLPSRKSSGNVLEVVQHEGAPPEKEGWKLYLVQEMCLTSLAKALEVWALRPHINESGVTDYGFLEDALNVLLDVASGLEYLHSKGIIHGDLKPDNIMLKQLDGRVIAKLTDFGLSTTLGPEATHVSNYCAGTPFYIAPEVVHSKTITPGADVFSFGVLAWQTLTAQPPWIMKPGKVMSQNPAFPQLPQPAYPSPIPELVHSCLRQDPKKRPCAAELVAQLKAMLQVLQVLLVQEGSASIGPGAGSKGLSAAGLGQGHSARPAAAPPAGLRAELDLRKAHSAGASACAWEQGGSALERKLEPVLEGSEERLTGSKSGLNGSRLLSFLKSQQSVAEEALGHLQAE